MRRLRLRIHYLGKRPQSQWLSRFQPDLFRCQSLGDFPSLAHFLEEKYLCMPDASWASSLLEASLRCPGPDPHFTNNEIGSESFCRLSKVPQLSGVRSGFQAWIHLPPSLPSFCDVIRMQRQLTKCNNFLGEVTWLLLSPKEQRKGSVLKP